MLIKLANYFSCSVDYLLGITDVSTPTNYLANNYNKHDLELINKYHSLSSEDKKCFDKFLLFLTDNSSAE